MRKNVKAPERESKKEQLASAPPSASDVSAPALLSFIKQVSAEQDWDATRLAALLNIEPADAPQIAATLEMLGYAEEVPDKKGLWRNTQAGKTVSGAKPPRLNRDSVLKALEELRDRVEQMNAAPASPFRVIELIAFGDFLDEHAKVQAANVGVGLAPKDLAKNVSDSAVERKREEHVLSDLRGKSTLLHLNLIEDWMRKRSHRYVLGRNDGPVS
ncbi:MAG TPA: hypothetical protein VKU01_19125 [Bryobacteraceae bacterium]|nr:hypothetical protein [Bryobacteraceae bacterium]